MPVDGSSEGSRLGWTGHTKHIGVLIARGNVKDCMSEASWESLERLDLVPRDGPRHGGRPMLVGKRCRVDSAVWSFRL